VNANVEPWPGWDSTQIRPPCISLSQLDGDDGLEMYRNHPFQDAFLAPDGNFYPRHSKLRPAASFEKGRSLEGPKARIYELEKRRVAEYLTPTEEEELQDLRRRHPSAEVVSNMNLVYDCWFDREFKLAKKAGLDIAAAIRQAVAACGHSHLVWQRSGTNKIIS
jgi:hypothetical protein